jgi:hypothetical protein
MRSDEVQPKDLAKRHAARRNAPTTGGFRRVSFTLPREEARERAREMFARYPKAAYMTEIEFWEELPDGRISVTMRRLPAAD